MARLPSTAPEQPLVASSVFVAEHYLPRGDLRRAETLTQLLRASDGQLRHALFLPADETYFAVFDSMSAEAVRAATAAAAQPRRALDRIVRAVLLDPVRQSE